MSVSPALAVMPSFLEHLCSMRRKSHGFLRNSDTQWTAEIQGPSKGIIVFSGDVSEPAMMLRDEVASQSRQNALYTCIQLSERN